MKLVYAKTHALLRLHDELLQLPFLQPVTHASGDREAVFILRGDGQTAILDVPDDLTPEQVAEIEQVVMAHQP